jgi:hypothetical protein
MKEDILKEVHSEEEKEWEIKRQHLALYHYDLVRYDNTIMGLAKALSDGVTRIGSSTVTGELLQGESSALGLKILKDCASAKDILSAKRCTSTGPSASKTLRKKAPKSRRNIKKFKNNIEDSSYNSSSWTTWDTLLKPKDVKHAVKSSGSLQFAVEIITKKENEITRLNKEMQSTAPINTATLKATEEKLVDLACDLEELLGVNRDLHNIVIDMRAHGNAEQLMCDKCDELSSMKYDAPKKPYERDTHRWFKNLPTEDRLDAELDIEMVVREMEVSV